ncbi:histone-like nucleoid-structuring protein Lsr2 [Agromyces kandeliae]|uniref:Lsr2 family protein n=1 Tax=Agromyces kandeliae TaxID=2666141 RepID=A0A6L5QXS5_9MICO|nr:Lsr2 family protein [Agromyces kandeliae]MRX42642.1 Lsr2 family protein [Agromyces kandeliae]
MAKRVVETLIDDLDGSDADRTLSFAFDGDQYSIDLSSANIDKLEAALAPYIGAARKTSARGGAPRRRGASAGAGDTKDAREWLRANGHQVSDRGRIPAPLMELYRNR